MKVTKIIQHNSFGSYTAPRRERNLPMAFKASTQYIDYIPPHEKFVDAMHVMGQGIPVQMKLLVGEARLHPDDQYIKSEGLRVAMENAKEDMYTVSSLSIDRKGRIVVNVSSEDFKITFIVPKESGPRLIGMTKSKEGGCNDKCGSECQCK